MQFSELAIPKRVMAGIRKCGFAECTPIQELTLPLSLAGQDVAGQAQTGTGKTAAFLIAAFSRLLQSSPSGSSRMEESQTDTPSDEASKPADRVGPSRPRALIIAPTRELAVQIENDALKLGHFLNLNIMAVYGGVDYEKQRTALISGGVDVLIGTPGRLIDYFKQKAYRVSEVEVLIIDEADRMFDMGFIDDLRFLLRRLPSFEQRLSMLFSATLSYRAQELSYEYMDSPVVLSTNMDTKAVTQVTQKLYHVEGKRKISLLVGLLRRDLTDGNGDASGRAMVFVNTKRMGEKLKEWLRINGIMAGYLSGDVPQTKRLQTLQRFQEGLMPVLIATDVAGRGLHIEGVTHVINFDLPENPEDYVHRIGRTARAGAKGDAISLVDEDGAYNLEAILTYLGMPLPVEWPEDDLLVKLDIPSHTERTEFVTRDKRTPARRRGPSATRQPSGATTHRVREVGGEEETPPVTSPSEQVSTSARRRRRRRKKAAPVSDHSAVNISTD